MSSRIALLHQRTPLAQPAFLPMSAKEMRAAGWDQLDILLLSGDAYVDHPSFGVPLLGRWLVAHGFRVGLVCQPGWADAEKALEVLNCMGRPRLFAGVSAGALDSMLAHYTAFRKKRSEDAYTPGGQAGARPNRALTVYANLLRRAFPALPLVGGGIEASLRRLCHYDFWTDSLRRSILFDARLDLLVYGMGEKALLEAARRLDTALSQQQEQGGSGPLTAESLGLLWQGIAGTARIISASEYTAREAEKPCLLPAYEAQLAAPRLVLEAALVHEKRMHQGGQPLVESCQNRFVWVEPPAPLMEQEALDALYALPFSRRAHPVYAGRAIPAESMMQASITSHRGCGGGCSFCSLSLHQGRRVASRSRDSIVQEAARIAGQAWFNGSISDVGGPSANMWQAHCARSDRQCLRASCLHPALCPHFKADQKACIALLQAVQGVKGVRHVRVASGVRFDLALAENAALKAYTGEFTGGQLKIAPEHCVPAVLEAMRKPGMPYFERFLQAFTAQSAARGKEQYVVPYLMSAFPGCTMDDMRALKNWLAARHWAPQQVQCFIPTPGTVASAMFYSGLNAEGKSIYVARSDAERMAQHALIAPDTGGRTPRPAHAQRRGAAGRKPLPKTSA